MNGENLLLLSFILFSLSSIAFLTNKNILMTLMSLELMLNAGNIALVYFAFVKQTGDAISWAFMFFALASAEAVIGLSILIKIVRNFKTIRIDEINTLKEKF